MKKRLLFLSAHLPSNAADQAGQKTAYRNLQVLSKEYDIDLVTFRTERERDWGTQELGDTCRSMTIIDMSTKDRIAGVLRSPRYPLVVGARNVARFEDTVKYLASRNVYDRAHCEWGQMAVYANLLAAVPHRTIYLHDVLSEWAGTRRNKSNSPFVEAFWNIECSRVESWEREAYLHFNRVFVPSGKDLELLTGINPDYQGRTAVIRLEFTSYKNALYKRRDKTMPQLIYWGAYSRRENVEGAMWVVQHVMPLVHRVMPEVTVTLVGADPPECLRKMESRCVRVTGRVDDPTPFFAQGSLAVLPLFVGAGVKVKVLECMSAGLPVITTPIGAEGLPWGRNDGLFVLDASPSAYSELIIFLLKDQELLRRLQKRASEVIDRYVSETEVAL